MITKNIPHLIISLPLSPSLSIPSLYPFSLSLCLTLSFTLSSSKMMAQSNISTNVLLIHFYVCKIIFLSFFSSYIPGLDFQIPFLILAQTEQYYYITCTLTKQSSSLTTQNKYLSSIDYRSMLRSHLQYSENVQIKAFDLFKQSINRSTCVQLNSFKILIHVLNPY